MMVRNNKAQEETQNNAIKFVEEKFEKRLSEELAKVKVEIGEVKSEWITRIEEVRAEMKSDKADLIKWMFIFWVGQIGAILGILFAFFKG